ncbi:MAG: dihydroorotate dehydrogenase electron transfer subunit [Candidatus Aminicenantes bacterium]|nr:dihydroorotate dehydrogenase electron transfer subunit [Candidatus Aminicenantes bacterium]
MLKNPEAKIVGREAWGDYVLLRFEAPTISALARPGQFLMVRVADGPYPLLRRPLGIHLRKDKALGVFFKIAGEGTALLARKRPGETLDVLGPLGNGFSVDPCLAGKAVFAVGGGRGIAPLYFLAWELRALGAAVKILYGGRTKDDVPLAARFRDEAFDQVLTTDDGSAGREGFVTAALEEEAGKAAPAMIFACGPDPMLEAVGRIAAARDIPAELSLESRMGCGFGACWGCVQRVRVDGKPAWVKICEDGPVFPAEAVVWDKDAR